MGSDLVDSVRGNGLSMFSVLVLFVVLGVIVNLYAGRIRKQRIDKTGVDDLLPY